MRRAPGGSALGLRLALVAAAFSAPAGCRPGAAEGPGPRAATPTVTRGGGPPTGRVEAGGIRFRDASEASGITFVHCSGDSPEKSFPTSMGSGVAMLDYDGDGRLDLYFATARNLPLDAPDRSQGNRLYRNRGGGTFEDVTERAGVGHRGGFTHGLAVGDFDGNGSPDLYLANLGPNVLYFNRGDGTFREASPAPGAPGPGWSTGAAPIDYDADGDLDLYVTSYGEWRFGAEGPFFGNLRTGERMFSAPTAIKPARHFLYLNRGDGTFEDATAEAGILRSDGRGMSALAADLNGDGRVDLFIGNDNSLNFTFLNRGDGTFEDASLTSGAGTNGAGATQASMGVDAEDLTGDDLPELVVTNFRDEYCTLYRNFDGAFQDTSDRAGIVEDSRPYVGWGCALADFDGDGLPDLFVANGHVDSNLILQGKPLPQAEPAVVWRNQGDGRFLRVRDPGPFFTADHVARGVAFGDLDDDGDVDVVISLMGRRPAILLNDSPPRPWIRLELLSGQPPRPATDARARVHAGGKVIHRQLKAGGSYVSAGDPRLLVGLGSADRVDKIEVLWPGGARSLVENPSPGRTHRLQRPQDRDAPSKAAK